MDEQIFLDFKLNFNLCSSKLDRPTLVYAVVYFRGKQYKISTGVKVYPNQWNKRKQIAMVSTGFTKLDNRNNSIVNSKLQEILYFRQQSTPASGTAKCYQPGLPCSSKSKSGRNLWCPDSGLCPQIPEYFRSSGNRNRRLYHLVQNSGNLRRRHPDCRITINIIWRDFLSRHKILI